MLWAIISSAFVIYLYRMLNATAGAEVSDAAIPANAIDAQMARLNQSIDAIENMKRGG